MLQYSELKNRASALLEDFNSFWRRLDLNSNQERLQEIEKILSQPGAWEDHEQFTPLLQEKSVLENRLARLDELKKAKEDLTDWLELAGEDQGRDVLQTIQEHLQILRERLDQAELHTLLSGDEDKHPAILEIHPGAGGTEAQDWAEMLLRMYKRWAERHDFSTRLLDYLDGEEAGLKSVTMQINGPYAYGLLKGEKGIHRLIRISPFDASGRRHTSFASVDVYPDVDQDIEIELKEEELRIDVFRSSGPGGQSVNKTSSAVRITHDPTGIVVQCQNEKSQRRNKESALKVLKARLYEIELKKIEESRQNEYASKEAISWGSQIRTYTLQPYRLIKDHRTNTENGNVEAVLDGDLDDFIRTFLLHIHG
ncbi:MAG: peptide chain release factor 2, partial [Desulfovibrionales bacterium]